jgi:DNA-binding NarL/FixJ family response regulator
MTGYKVFVIWSNPLFFEAVRLLLHESAVPMVGATSEHRTAQEQIEKLKPEVVILERSEGQPQEIEEQETMAILKSGAHVFRLSLSDNELNVYRRERRTVGKIEDLVNLLTGESSHRNSGA